MDSLIVGVGGSWELVTGLQMTWGLLGFDISPPPQTRRSEMGYLPCASKSSPFVTITSIPVIINFLLISHTRTLFLTFPSMLLLSFWYTLSSFALWAINAGLGNTCQLESFLLSFNLFSPLGIPTSSLPLCFSRPYIPVMPGSILLYSLPNMLYFFSEFFLLLCLKFHMTKLFIYFMWILPTQHDYRHLKGKDPSY